MTLRHWVRRLEAHRAEALRHVDEPTYRVWRLFIAEGAEVRGDFLEAIGKPGKAPFLEEDLLNCAAAETLLHGGEVFLVEPELLPSQAAVAGLFRYSLGPNGGE